MNQLYSKLETWGDNKGFKPVDGLLYQSPFLTVDILRKYKLPVGKTFLLVNKGAEYEFCKMKVIENYDRFVVFRCTPVGRLSVSNLGYTRSFNTTMFKRDLVIPDITLGKGGVVKEFKSEALCKMPSEKELDQLIYQLAHPDEVQEKTDVKPAKKKEKKKKKSKAKETNKNEKQGA